MNRISKRINKKVIELPKDYLKELIEYDWPGNIRELENLIELMLNTGSIDYNHIKSKKPISSENYIDIEEAEFNLEKVEKEIIIKALKRFKGNITNCAKALGIGRNTLYRKISKYNIDCSEFET
ncbi:MAG: hypothetical protein GX941_03050 [Candidatus Methanofastidiosa archaeon]|nr:hypothetical protein [Candidatus Methanofastidiosa archaeon]